MDSLIITTQRGGINYNQEITKDKIKELSTDTIKQYLFGKTIKEETINHDMLKELKKRGIDTTKYKTEK